MSAFFISMREHICNFISPAKATKPSNTFDCHKLKAAWQFRVIGFRKMAHFHKFSNAKIITMKCAPLRTNPTTNKDQINSNQLKRQPQSIWKFLWVGCFVTTCVRVCLCLFVDILCKFQLPLGGSTPPPSLYRTRNKFISKPFICGYLLFSKNCEWGIWGGRLVETLQYGNSVLFSFTFEGSLLASFRLPPTMQLLLLCPAQLSSVQFGLVLVWLGSVRFSWVRPWLHLAVNKVRDAMHRIQPDSQPESVQCCSAIQKNIGHQPWAKLS